MIYRSIADTGIDVSIIGLGTVKLGRDQGVKYPDKFTIPSDKEASALIQCAKDAGVNLIDTAPAYGNSEERLGKLLGGQRHDWVICSKVGEDFLSQPEAEGASFFDFSKKHTVFSVERSLKRLQTDFIDFVLVHSDGNDIDIIQQHGTLETLAELKKQGKIRAFGMSTKTLEGGLLAAEQSDFVMITYNLNQHEEQPVIDYCQKNNTGCLIKKALASGHICKNDKKNNVDSVQDSFNFIFQQQGVSSAIVGTISKNHLQQNIRCALKALS